MDVELDPHIIGPVAFKTTNRNYFLEGSTVTARFNLKEGEAIPPEGFEVQTVEFGGDQQTVIYKVTRPDVRIESELFYGHRAFTRYRDGLAAFHAYRQQIINKLRNKQR